MSEIDLIARRHLEAVMNYQDRQKILQDRAIKREMRRMYRKRMLINGLLFIVAAVSIFALIRWLGP